jgi:amino acid transporter
MFWGCIYFVRARKAQGVPEESLAYKAPLGVAGSYFALGFEVLSESDENAESQGEV